MESSNFKPKPVVSRRQALDRGYFVGLAALLGVGIALLTIAFPAHAASASASVPVPVPYRPISRAAVEAISPEIAEALRRREFALGAPIADADVPRAIADPAFDPVLRGVKAEFCARPSSARTLSCPDTRSRSGAQ